MFVPYFLASLNNPNYILNKCIKMIKNQNKYENVIAVRDESIKKCSTLKVKLNEIKLYL